MVSLTATTTGGLANPIYFNFFMVTANLRADPICKLRVGGYDGFRPINGTGLQRR